MELIFKEGDFLIKTLSAYEELEAAFRLRHEVFCEELRWVPASPGVMERDDYDSFAQSVGVFDEKNNLLGNVRLTHASNRFMIEKEFAFLLPVGKGFKKTLDMAEVTRLCVKRNLRLCPDIATKVSLFLYKGVYQWSIHNDVRYLTMVVEKNNYRLLRLTGFPVKRVDGFKAMNGGVEAGVLILDLRNFEKEAREKKPELISWMSQLSSLAPWRLLRHGLC
jgi:N-acyl-L-homoserine lactone synthetase